jgi:hypothetical protein
MINLNLNLILIPIGCLFGTFVGILLCAVSVYQVGQLYFTHQYKTVLHKYLSMNPSSGALSQEIKNYLYHNKEGVTEFTFEGKFYGYGSFYQTMKLIFKGNRVSGTCGKSAICGVVDSKHSAIYLNVQSVEYCGFITKTGHLLTLAGQWIKSDYSKGPFYVQHQCIQSV